MLALQAIEPVRQAQGLTGKPLAPPQAEVVLNTVGAFARPPGPIIAKAREAAEAVSARRFKVVFDRVVGADGDLVLQGDDGTMAAQDLFAAIHKALVRPGMAPRRQPEFTPRLVLMREPTAVPETPVEPIAWTVRDFVLIYAIPAEGRHEVAARFALTD